MSYDYGYEGALQAAGCEVLDFKEFRSYQGEWLACVKTNEIIGVAEGWYGSCSDCDAFEAEFGWDGKETPDYEQRLKSFGEGYLPALPFEHYIVRFEKRVKGREWDDEALEMLKTIVEWKERYTNN